MTPEGNPLVLRLRRRQGIWGAFHRSNLGPLAAAILLYVGVALSLKQLGMEAVGWIFLFFNVVVFLMACIAATATVGHQVRAARTQRTWDELLLTLLTDRELVNGQLFLALRPTLLLLWLASPVHVVLLLCVVWSLFVEQPPVEALLWTIALLVAFAVAFALATVVVLSLAIMSFHAALSGRRAIGRLVIFVLGIGIVIAAPPLLFLLVPLLLFIPGLCWYQHRLLCCTLRERLLAEEG